MLNKLAETIRRYEMIAPGDHVCCAVSGGADSVALLYGLYLLAPKLGFTLSAAHFNHHLRGEESDRDQAFVEGLCHRLDIPLCVGEGREITPGRKGLEAAARDARYQFLLSLPGKIATAHTADDNAETVLMHLIRGTGLKGLGGIPPVSGKLLRPMLNVTRREVEDFLRGHNLRHVEDSSNGSDGFLRNRLRHWVMPLLQKENPQIRENLSQMAQSLRLDEDYLLSQTGGPLPTVPQLRALPAALRRRYLVSFLADSGVLEPEQSHIALAEALVFSENPSAQGHFPGGVIISRRYDRLEKRTETPALPERVLTCPGTALLPEAGLKVTCKPALTLENTRDKFTVLPVGQMKLRARQPGDRLTLSGGTKTLKKRMIDEKIPASHRNVLPVLADDQGILGVFGFGADKARIPESLPAVTITFQKITDGENISADGHNMGRHENGERY